MSKKFKKQPFLTYSRFRTFHKYIGKAQKYKNIYPENIRWLYSLAMAKVDHFPERDKREYKSLVINEIANALNIDPVSVRACVAWLSMTHKLTDVAEMEAID